MGLVFSIYFEIYMEMPTAKFVSNKTLERLSIFKLVSVVTVKYESQYIVVFEVALLNKSLKGTILYIFTAKERPDNTNYIIFFESTLPSICQHHVFALDKIIYY